ncbi:hypothetical protein LTR84_002912 [Exophiala bonariae]|uniref:Cytochrome P450 n=1 Tax=Exophiala bonariae TaxID=1690606 RepID=A0AAV9N990_9EURO|nr:hypothetical protein LTR84_002912 [Exophiala bonariae]
MAKIAYGPIGMVGAEHVTWGRGLAGAFATLMLWYIGKATYNIFLHPLRKVPGPFVAKFTSKWLEYQGFTGHKTATLHNMHQKFGPVVRVAPDELLFSDPALIKKIYGFKASYLKTSFYTGFDDYGEPVLFTLRDRSLHRDRKKLMAHAFSESTILQGEHLVAEQIEKFLSKIEDQQGTAMDVYMWFRCLTLDIVSSLFMGASFETLDKRDHEYMDSVDSYFVLAGLKWQIPWLIPLTSWIPWARWQHFLGAQTKIYNLGRSSFKDYLERHGRNSGRQDALTKIIHGDKVLPPLSDEQIALEIGSILVAGTDTTATVLTYLCWELAKMPTLQVQLRDELKQAILGYQDKHVPKYSDLKFLPLLEGIVLEGLRLHGPAVGSIPRVVPIGGDMLGEYFVPAGTTVGIQAYTTHHDPTIFPDPDTFKPERWANGGTREMKDASLPWSKGSRMCPGLHLATLELKAVLAALSLGWELSLGPNMKDDTMDMIDNWVLMPKGNFCDIVFKPLAV